jgi:hypothetical protein
VVVLKNLKKILFDTIIFPIRIFLKIFHQIPSNFYKALNRLN